MDTTLRDICLKATYKAARRNGLLNTTVTGRIKVSFNIPALSVWPKIIITITIIKIICTFLSHQKVVSLRIVAMARDGTLKTTLSQAVQ